MSNFARAFSQAGASYNTILLPAILSRQGGRINIAVTLPCTSLSKFVKTTSTRNKGDIMPKNLLNRFLDKDHVRGIEKYIQEEEKFIIPPITLVADKRLISGFTSLSSVEEDKGLSLDELLDKYTAIAGTLALPIDYVFMCLDGNHRVSGIQGVANIHPEILQSSSVLLNIIIEEDTLKIRQDFVDINSNSRPTSASINTLFDTRNKISYMVARTINKNNYLRDTTELISTSVGAASKSIYTTNNIKNAIVELMGVNCQSSKSVKKLAERLNDDVYLLNEAERRSMTFFSILKENESMKKCLLNYDNIIKERQECIILGGVGLIILSRVCAKAFEMKNGAETITKLREIMNYDWSRNNEFLKAKILNDKGKIISSSASISETSNSLIGRFYSNVQEAAITND